ncbi:hypothetical protein IG631_21206 [Alternaria alternata]|nr:hypothetical protein IG631_21206 [Alternaria alternata]
MACSSGSGANTSSCNCAKFEQGGLNGTCQSCGCPVNWHSKAAGGTKKENKKYVHVPRPMRLPPLCDLHDPSRSWRTVALHEVGLGQLNRGCSSNVRDRANDIIAARAGEDKE